MSSARPFFFVKIMKTGGGTFLQHVLANFERAEVYPYDPHDGDMEVANVRIDHLLAVSEERRRQIRVYTGHFPYVAVELLGVDATTLTIVRDPVERTISYLRHCRRYHPQHRDMRLQEIYEDPFYFPCFIQNHQAKLFALTSTDQPESFMDVLDVDEERLARARENLERVDVVGLREQFDDLLAEMASRYGWRFGAVPDRHVSTGGEVAPSFRRRIAADNAADMAFYDHAVTLWSRRRRREFV